MADPLRMDQNWAISIQAGGQSRRMGQDKGLAHFNGRPLVARVVEQLSGLGAALLITTNQPEEYAFLGQPLFTDLLPGKGPLGGLYTALCATQKPVIAVVGCDMPFIVPALLAAERDLLLGGGYDVVVPRSPDGLEPLLALYRREACLPAVRAALGAGERKMTAWYSTVQAQEMDVEVVALYDPQFRSFINLNTPEEFRAAEDLARRLTSTGK